MSKTKVKFTKKIGSNSFEFECEVTSQADFFEKSSFFSSLPSVGPTGEDDLVLQYRKTKGGFEYYSIVSEKAGQEFKFGQSKATEGDLFPKGWEPIYVPETDSEEASEAPKRSTRSSRKKKAAPAPTPTEVVEEEDVAVEADSSDSDDLLAELGF